MNICESITTTARIWPDKFALISGDRRMTYKELNRLTSAAAEQLRNRDVTVGDRVALRLPNTPAFAVWYYAALRIGAIVVSVSTRLADPEVVSILEDCEASVLIVADDQDSLAQPPACLSSCVVTSTTGDHCDGTLLDVADEAAASASTWHDAQPDDAALILYTSGTTGFAKGATLSHGNVRSNVFSFNHLCNMRPCDRILLAVPLFHCFGQNALLNSALNVGATLVMQNRFDLNESKKLIAEHKITQLYGVPMMFQLLHDSCQPSDLASIEYCFTAAANMPIQVAESWWDKFGMPVHEGYGLTETSPFASYNHRDRFVPGSIGMPIDNVEMKIVDTETGEECPAGELGEIAIRGPNVMIGYWNRPQDTALAIRDGWFHSGDIGKIDDDGFFYIVDRVKDMITIGGLKVYPAEVERVLLDHASIAQVAVVGIPDSVFGEQVVAFVVLADDADPDKALTEINAYAAEHLGNYKRPRQFFPIDRLPVNPSGKIKKTELREVAAQSPTLLQASDTGQSLDGATSPAAGSITVDASRLQPATLKSSLASAFPSEHAGIATEFVRETVARLAGLDELPKSDSRFLELGLDSLLVVELSGQVQVELGESVIVPATLVFDYPRVTDLAQYLVATIVPGASAAPTAGGVPEPKHLKKTGGDIRSEIEEMSDEEALEQLLGELN